ncbi:cyclase family protein [Aquisediminimonas profunda]|uniref:cyclase family protein n=1 Tax=Aquisediminimonas profunda TaxID=1550733 RepID=UPI001C637189|nr:cyclase family protein [Aquisediminimonas profunda]
MPRRYVDLSMTLSNDVISDPPFLKPHIDYETHKDTRHELENFFPGADIDGIIGGDPFCASEWVKLTTHSGTHVDAPWHYHAQQDASLPGGARASQTIDQMPLEWFLNPGVKLDFRHKKDGYVVTADDIEAELERIGHDLQPLDIVVVNTAAGMALANRDPAYVSRGAGVGYEGTMYLLERGVRVTGTDAWSWDAPFVHTKAKVEETSNPKLIWEGHRAGHDIGYCHIEKMHNLEAIPSTGFTISCFPAKIQGASAGWTRAVAIFED